LKFASNTIGRSSTLGGRQRALGNRSNIGRIQSPAFVSAVFRKVRNPVNTANWDNGRGAVQLN
jgi:hypothetical protein